MKKISDIKLEPDIFIFSVAKDSEYNTPKEVEGRKRIYQSVALRVKKDLGLPFVYNNIEDRKYSNIFLCKNEPSKDQVSALKYILSNKA